MLWSVPDQLDVRRRASRPKKDTTLFSRAATAGSIAVAGMRASRRHRPYPPDEATRSGGRYLIRAVPP